MPETDDPDFLSIESELRQLRDHLGPLKKEIEGYKSANQQLAAGRETLQKVGEQLTAHGERMASAADQAIAALSSASHALKPIGTTEIRTELEIMQRRLSQAVSDIENQFAAVKKAAAEMQSSAEFVQTIPSLVSNNATERLEHLAHRLETRLSEQDGTARSEFKSLRERIELLEQSLNEAESSADARMESLLEAIEQSAPIGIFRRKK